VPRDLAHALGSLGLNNQDVVSIAGGACGIKCRVLRSQSAEAASGFNTEENDMSGKITFVRANNEASKNHCAYCHGKFGMVRHRRAFKAFCSQKCVDQHQTWLRAEVRKRRSWLDCLWSASLNVTAYARERSPGQQYIHAAAPVTAR
jgi:hypothetical protein